MGVALARTRRTAASAAARTVSPCASSTTSSVTLGAGTFEGPRGIAIAAMFLWPDGSGGTPGTAKTGNAQEKQEIASSKKSGDILPDQKFSIPKLRAANVHLTYKGDHIENKYVPLDNIVVAMDIVDGHVTLHPLNFKVGSGSIDTDFDLNPVGDDLRTKATLSFRHVDLSRIMQATHTFKGQGVLGGQADITTTGASVASMLGNGSGGVTMVISGNGNISALLDDIAGLEVGNAILSALGLPNRADLRCFIADMPLKDGILSMKTFLLQTTERVGKTWLAISLAQCLATRGLKVLLFDGDLGLANVDIQLGLTPKQDLSSVLSGRVALAQVIIRHEVSEQPAAAFDIVPGRSGAASIAALELGLLDQLIGSVRLLRGYDIVLLDLGAGIDPVTRFMAAGDGAGALS